MLRRMQKKILIIKKGLFTRIPEWEEKRDGSEYVLGGIFG